LTGQLGPIERKSLEPIADEAGVESRCLQQFFSRYEWSEHGVREHLQRMVCEVMPAEGLDLAFVVDDTSDSKKGRHTAGVARQWCGSMGKVENCIASVFLGCYGLGRHLLVDGELFLPEEWNANAADEEITLRRKMAGIPGDVGHVTKISMALKQIKRARQNGLPARWVVADSGYGGKPTFRRGVAALGLWYVVEAVRNHKVWALPPMAEEKSRSQGGRGRPLSRPVFTSKPVSIESVAEGAWNDIPWKPYVVHDTEKGPAVWEVKAGPVWTVGEDGMPEQAQWLVVARNPLDKDGETKHILSNAAPSVPLEKLLEVFFERWRVETCFRDSKEELGLDHAEIRTYRGINRHLILTIVNFFYLQTRVNTLQKKLGADHLPTCGRDAEVA
jgi:SRSO17 transposase